MDDTHYHKDGIDYDRPTRILDYFCPPELLDYKMRVGKKEANRVGKIAMKHGSRIDELIRINQEPSKKDSQEVKSCWEGWLKWKNHHNPKNLMFPETHYCEVRRVAGTPDIFWADNSDLIDVKSSRVIHENYFFQLGFYASVLPYPIKRLAVLRLDKMIGDYEYVTNENAGLSIADCINGFNGLLMYYRAYQRVQSTLKPKGIIPAEEEV